MFAVCHSLLLGFLSLNFIFLRPKRLLSLSNAPRYHPFGIPCSASGENFPPRSRFLLTLSVDFPIGLHLNKYAALRGFTLITLTRATRNEI